MTATTIRVVVSSVPPQTVLSTAMSGLLLLQGQFEFGGCLRWVRRRSCADPREVTAVEFEHDLALVDGDHFFDGLALDVAPAHASPSLMMMVSPSRRTTELHGISKPCPRRVGCSLGLPRPNSRSLRPGVPTTRLSTDASPSPWDTRPSETRPNVQPVVARTSQPRSSDSFIVLPEPSPA